MIQENNAQKCVSAFTYYAESAFLKFKIIHKNKR